MCTCVCVHEHVCFYSFVFCSNFRMSMWTSGPRVLGRQLFVAGIAARTCKVGQARRSTSAVPPMHAFCVRSSLVPSLGCFWKMAFDRSPQKPRSSPIKVVVDAVWYNPRRCGMRVSSFTLATLNVELLGKSQNLPEALRPQTLDLNAYAS